VTVTDLPIPVDHPAYAGHFPGQPILPGVVILDASLRVIAEHSGRTPVRWRIVHAKFKSPVAPGESLTVEHGGPRNGPVRLTVRAGARVVAVAEIFAVWSAETHSDR
jgi:3-hydroxymyristoyl/3-hydroxydecanoyl-(acyl carrier protein) dehydratase